MPSIWFEEQDSESKKYKGRTQPQREKITSDMKREGRKRSVLRTNQWQWWRSMERKQERLQKRRWGWATASASHNILPSSNNFFFFVFWNNFRCAHCLTNYVQSTEWSDHPLFVQKVKWYFCSASPKKRRNRTEIENRKMIQNKKLLLFDMSKNGKQKFLKSESRYIYIW